MAFFPKALPTAMQGEAGINHVAKIVNDRFCWIFRRTHNEHDYGIDGHVDVVASNGDVTGQQFAVQIKCGASYFKEKNPRGVIFRDENTHLGYYRNYPMPIIIILFNPVTAECVWTNFDPQKLISNKTGWLTTIPSTNVLADAKAEILKLLPTVMDVSGELEHFWKLAGVVKDGGIAILVITLDEVSERDFTFANSFFERLMLKKSTCRMFESSVDILFDGIEDNRLELYEIEDCRNYVVDLVEKNGEVGFFLRKNETFGFFGVLPMCYGFVEKKSHSYELGDKINVQVDMQRMPHLVEVLFLGLNRVTTWLDMHIDDNRRLTKDILSSLRLPLPLTDE